MKINEQFPYLEPNSKAKFFKRPYVTREEKAIEFYEKYGSISEGIDQADNFDRFERTKTYFTDTSGKEYSNNITLSKPSADVICVRRQDGDVEICLLLQRRSPYKVQIEHKSYVRFFWEHVGGLLEDGETLETTAIREAEEETGYEVLKIEKLISPIICKHVSYADESTAMFWAVMGKNKGQHLDDAEDIKPVWMKLAEVEAEFEDYMDGKKDNFFYLDLPEMTMLCLQRFFVKYHRGDIAL